MATTSTPRFALIKPTPGTGELVDVAADLNSNWDKIDAAITGNIIKRHKRITAATSTTATAATSAQGVLRIDNIPVVAGRVYGVFISQGIWATAASDARVKTYVTTSTVGSASASSPAFLDIQHTTKAPGLVDQGLIMATYLAAASANLSIFLGHYMITGAGSSERYADATWPIEMVITDMGVDTGATGGVNL